MNERLADERRAELCRMICSAVFVVTGPPHTPIGGVRIAGLDAFGCDELAAELARVADLERDLAANKAMLARQCDLAREAETGRMKAEREVQIEACNFIAADKRAFMLKEELAAVTADRDRLRTALVGLFPFAEEDLAMGDDDVDGITPEYKAAILVARAALAQPPKETPA